jgi:hypothetical protein
VDNGTLVIYSEAAAAAASKIPFYIRTVRFGQDGKYIATGGGCQIKVCSWIFSFLFGMSSLIEVPSAHCRFGRSNANEFARFSTGTRIVTSVVSTFRLMVVFSRLLITAVRFVYGAYAMARQSVFKLVTLLAVSSFLLPLVQMDDISLPEMMMGI